MDGSSAGDGAAGQAPPNQNMPPTAPQPASSDVEEAPDPEEDYLDDLDGEGSSRLFSPGNLSDQSNIDVLDEFSAPSRADAVKKQNDLSAPELAKNEDGAQDQPNQQSSATDSEDEFAKQLESGMAELLGEIESSVSAYYHQECILNVQRIDVSTSQRCVNNSRI